MYKVTKILDIKPYKIICEVNDNLVYEIDVLPLIEKHKNFSGIEKLLEKNYFKTVAIGEMGELFWKGLIFLNDFFWNYDISPEFIVEHGKLVSLQKAE